MIYSPLFLGSAVRSNSFISEGIWVMEFPVVQYSRLSCALWAVLLLGCKASVFIFLSVLT